MRAHGGKPQIDLDGDGRNAFNSAFRSGNARRLDLFKKGFLVAVLPR